MIICESYSDEIHMYGRFSDYEDLYSSTASFLNAGICDEYVYEFNINSENIDEIIYNSYLSKEGGAKLDFNAYVELQKRHNPQLLSGIRFMVANERLSFKEESGWLIFKGSSEKLMELVVYIRFIKPDDVIDPAIYYQIRYLEWNEFPEVFDPKKNKFFDLMCIY